MMCHVYAISLGRLFAVHTYFFFFSSCTILRPQSMTPRITCDAKSPMTDRLGPLVRPRFPVRYPIDSRAWPSPLWAYSTFSTVLFPSFQFAPSPALFSSILFYSIPFYYAFCSIRFPSTRFSIIRCDSTSRP